MESNNSTNPAPVPRAASRRERGLSLLIAGVLVIIAAVMIYTQSRFDAAQWQERASGPGSPPAARSRPIADAGGRQAVDGLLAMSEPESYDARTLSDKINGKAEFYLSAGFKALDTQRFSLAQDSGLWLERYVYDMGRQRNAYAVFSSQRRQTATPLDFVNHGFLSANGLFFVHGPYYVEIIAADASEPVQDKMKALAAHFVKIHDGGKSELAVFDLFPPGRQVANSFILIADSAFGLAGLDWVYTALYQDGPDEATAFLRPCDSAEAARSLADAFTAYWLEFDGQRVALPDGPSDAEAVTILDNFEIVLVQGRYIFGVHEATRLEFGLEITERMQQIVKDNAP